MAWAYLNFAAMIVGYITIAVVILIVLIFIAFVIREKLSNMEWRKKNELEKQTAHAAAETRPGEQKEAKEAENPNVQINLK
jgi:uncharacterized membrane protein YcjF (UPF0283 family)